MHVKSTRKISCYVCLLVACELRHTYSFIYSRDFINFQTILSIIPFQAVKLQVTMLTLDIVSML